MSKKGVGRRAGRGIFSRQAGRHFCMLMRQERTVFFYGKSLGAGLLARALHKETLFSGKENKVSYNRLRFGLSRFTALRPT